MKESFNLLRDRLRNRDKQLIMLILMITVSFAALATLSYFYIRDRAGGSNKGGNASIEQGSSSSIFLDVTTTSYTTPDPTSSETSSLMVTESSLGSDPNSSVSSIPSSPSTASTTTTSIPPSSSSSSVPAPETPSAFVAFYSDTQSDTDTEDANHQRVVNYMLGSGANPVFHAGDVMEDGTQASLDRFNNVTATLRSTRSFYAALGNNDRVYGDSSTPSPLFLGNFSFPGNEQWYSINTGNLHVVVLDSAFSSGSTEQMNWFVADISGSGSQSRITAVIFHHPSFRSAISTYVVNYGVEFVVAGHEHSYQHTNPDGVHTFVLSGQPSIGYMAATVYEGSVTLTAYNSGNGVIESVGVSER